jgi:hypothetical protein
MTERVDHYLDGTADASSLSASDYQAARTAERIIDETGALLAAKPAPDLTADVMRRIEALADAPAKRRATGISRVLARLWTPRRVAFQWRPAYALAAAAALFILIIFLPQQWRTPQAEPRMFVQFRFSAADAMDVRLAGSFTNWEPRYELHQTQPGLWTITLPLAPGVHDYMFIVDGQRWIPDPAAPQVDDGFGGVNSRLALVLPDTPRL